MCPHAAAHRGGAGSGGPAVPAPAGRDRPGRPQIGAGQVIPLAPEPVELDSLTPADIPVLVELEEMLFPGDSPWTAQMFAGELAAGHHYVVHRDGDGVVDGYAGIALLSGEAEVHTIGVRPAAQGSGIVGIRRRYYRPSGADAYTMARPR